MKAMDEEREQFLREHPLEKAYLEREVAPDELGTKAEHAKEDLSLIPPEPVEHEKGGEVPADQWMYT